MRKISYQIGMVTLLLLTLSIISQANADMITYHVTFNATGFYDSFFPPVYPPTDPVSGSFTITFDPTVYGYSETTTGINLDSLNIDLDSEIAFAYFNDTDTLFIGGIQSGINTAVVDSDDFMLLIQDFTSSPSFSDFFYTQSIIGHGWVASDISCNVSVVPLPGSRLLLGTGLLGLGAAGWRRKRRQ